MAKDWKRVIQKNGSKGFFLTDDKTNRFILIAEKDDDERIIIDSVENQQVRPSSYPKLKLQQCDEGHSHDCNDSMGCLHTRCNSILNGPDGETVREWINDNTKHKEEKCHHCNNPITGVVYLDSNRSFCSRICLDDGRFGDKLSPSVPTKGTNWYNDEGKSDEKSLKTLFKSHDDLWHSRDECGGKCSEHQPPAAPEAVSE